MPEAAGPSTAMIMLRAPTQARAELLKGAVRSGEIVLDHGHRPCHRRRGGHTQNQERDRKARVKPGGDVSAAGDSGRAADKETLGPHLGSRRHWQAGRAAAQRHSGSRRHCRTECRPWHRPLLWPGAANRGVDRSVGGKGDAAQRRMPDHEVGGIFTAKAARLTTSISPPSHQGGKHPERAGSVRTASIVISECGQTSAAIAGMAAEPVGRQGTASA